MNRKEVSIKNYLENKATETSAYHMKKEMLIKDAFTDYRNSLEKKGIRGNSLETVDKCFKGGLLQFYQEQQIQDIDIQWLENFKEYCLTKKNKRTGKGLSDSTIKNYWSNNSQFLTWLANNDYIDENPVKYVVSPQYTAKEKSKWSEEEFNRFINCFAITSIYVPIFKLAYYLGLSRGEIIGLTWDNIDLYSGILVVEKIITENGKKEEAPEIKTYAIPKEVKFELEYLYEMNVSCFKTDMMTEDYVFDNGFLEPLSFKTLNDNMKRAIAKSGVKKIAFSNIAKSLDN